MTKNKSPEHHYPEAEAMTLMNRLPEPLYQTLEQLARQHQQSVPAFIEEVIQNLVLTFATAEGSPKT